MKKKIYVGGTLRDVGKRFIDAVRKVERGGKVVSQSNVTFLSWTALSAVMSDKRHELLVHLNSHPTKTVRALARALKRDYKRVYEDVKALKTVGLIDVEEGMLRADYDEIQTTIKVKKAA